MYSDAESARKVMMVELKKVIEANPLLRDKLEFPNIANHRLRRLINQRFLFSFPSFNSQFHITTRIHQATNCMQALVTHIEHMQVRALLHAHMHVGFSSEFLDMSICHSDKTDFCI
jgi:hypothetical protein